MAVAFDASSGLHTFNAISSASWTHTPSGTPDYVRVPIGTAVLGLNRAVPTVTYGGAAMSIGDRTGSNTGYQFTVTGDSCLWEKIAPASGAQTVSLTWATGAYFGAAGSITYTGVHQTTASGTAVTATGTGTAVSVTVSSSAGDMISDAMSTDIVQSSSTGNRTQRFSGSGGSGGDGYYWGAGQDTTTSGSVAMSWTTGASTAWSQVGSAILQAAAGGVISAVPVFKNVAGM